MSSMISVLESIVKGHKTGNLSIDGIFGDFYADHPSPEVLKGWDLRPEKVQEAFSKGEMYHADIDTPNRKCILSCGYCFVHEDDRYDKKGVRRASWLSLDEWADTMSQLKGEGVSSVKIVGQGETTHDTHFFEYLSILQKLSITPVVFTSGYVFGNDELAMKIHGISGEEAIERTMDLGASIMMKFDSPIASVQDAIAHTKGSLPPEFLSAGGYTAIRNNAIRRFMQRDDIHEGDLSRFGLETNLGSHNINDIFAIFSLRKLAAIHPDICLTMDCGAKGRLSQNDTISGLSRGQIEEVYAGISFLNKELGMRDPGVAPYIGVMNCSQVSLPSVYVAGRGEIYFSCCGNTNSPMGNVREMTIKDARKIAMAESKRFDLPLSHGCPFREDAGIIHPTLKHNVGGKLEKLERGEYTPIEMQPIAEGFSGKKTVYMKQV